MGSINTPSAKFIDRILNMQVEEGKPITVQLHNACLCAITMDGNGLRKSPQLNHPSLMKMLHESVTLYSAAYGSRDLARSQPITLDSVFWISSLMSLSTAVAAPVAVVQALDTLEQNIREIVPELREIDVLGGFDDDGAPRLRKMITRRKSFETTHIYAAAASQG